MNGPLELCLCGVDFTLPIQPVVKINHTSTSIKTKHAEAIDFFINIFQSILKVQVQFIYFSHFFSYSAYFASWSFTFYRMGFTFFIYFRCACNFCFVLERGYILYVGNGDNMLLF